VNIWLHRHKQGGLESLKDGRRLSPRKGHGLLTAAEARRVQVWIRDKCPDQMKLPYGLWTASVVRDLIHRRFGKMPGLSTVQTYLKQWGFTPQRPLSRAIERRPGAIAAWLQMEYPKIKRRTKREKALIWRGDETGISNQDHAGRGYAPAGKTPVLHKSARKLTTSMISAVNNRGGMKFMCFQGTMKADLFIMFLRRLIRNAPGKVFLIVDNLRVHHAVKVRQWTEKHSDKIMLFFLPPYAPEYNPDEYLNNDLKMQLRNRIKPKTQDELEQSVSDVMMDIQRNRKRVQSYFHADDVRYAA
jgi:transposase